MQNKLMQGGMLLLLTAQSIKLSSMFDGLDTLKSVVVNICVILACIAFIESRNAKD